MQELKTLIRRLLFLFIALFGIVVVLWFGLLLKSTPNAIFKTVKTTPVNPTKWASGALILNTDGMPDLVKRGYDLVTETASYLGPNAPDKSLRYSGNNLACANCHLKSGTQAGAASWAGIMERFPQFSGRENRIITLEDRINGCLERSMNGKKLPITSESMQAMVAYMDWLGTDMPSGLKKAYKGYVSLKIPEEVVDLKYGKEVYDKECVVCHGANGQGIKKTSGPGYLYPPLWGKDSYNDGAGMNRVLTAAQFIKGNMPFGQATKDRPKLTDSEAYHVAGYINSFERPIKKDKEKDYPDLKLKPVSTPYGPWLDEFSAEQHRFGTFNEIIEYYQEKYNIKKTK